MLSPRSRVAQITRRVSRTQVDARRALAPLLPHPTRHQARGPPDVCPDPSVSSTLTDADMAVMVIGLPNGEEDESGAKEAPEAADFIAWLIDA